MTGPEHYHEAERILNELRMARASVATIVTPEKAAAVMAEAQVHATLAQAAAVAALLADRYVGDGEHINDWRRASGLHGEASRD